MKKINFYNVVIEVTRRCNFACEHCLRGDAQNTDMAYKWMTEFLKRTKRIGSLSISGGEPSLKEGIDRARYFLNQAQELKVPIDNFYIATNASFVNPDFIKLCLEYWLYCEEGREEELNHVQWSNDEFHINNEEMVSLLKGLSFTSPRYNKDLYNYKNYAGVIKEGKWEEYSVGREETERELEIEEDGCICSDIYLNAKGWIINGCNWSYNSQNDHCICHVLDMDFQKFSDYAHKKM